MAEMNSTKDVYVETAAFRRTLEGAENNRLVVITGPEHSGKSCIGHAILRHYHEKGFQPLIVKTFLEFREHVSRHNKQAVLFDHVFGRDQLDSFKTWLDSLPVVGSSVTEGKLKAIFTVNDRVFKQITRRQPTFREHYDSVDLSRMSQFLTAGERELMLEKHWNQRNADRSTLSYDEVDTILRQNTQAALFPYHCGQYAANPNSYLFPEDQEAVRCDMSGLKVTVHLSPAMTQSSNSDPFPLHEEYLHAAIVSEYFKNYGDELKKYKTSEGVQQLTAHLHQQVASKFKETELHTACRVGNVEKVKTLLRDGEDPDLEADSSITPLHVACYEGQEEVVRVLLSHNADKTATDTDGWSPLHLASHRGHTTIVELLLTHGEVSTEEEIASADINFECCYEHKRLVQELRSCEVAKITKHPRQISLCCHCCDVKYRHLIQNVQKHNQYINKGTRNCKQTALYLASQGGHSAVVQVLLEHGACTDVTDDKDLEHYRGKERAASAEIMEDQKMWLLDWKIGGYVRRPLDRFRYQWTALHAASSMGNVEVVRLLLKYFASARQTTMHVACCNGQSKVVDLLQDYGIPTNVRDKDSNLPLHVACSARLAGKVQPSLRQIVTDQLTDVIRTLLKFNPKDVQKAGEDGKSPLCLACRHGSSSMVRCLLEKGAKVEPDLVLIACKRGQADTLKVLLENNADLDERNEDSLFPGEDSPLYFACEKGFEEVVETLIDHGHRTDYNNKDGWGTLLHITIAPLEREINTRVSEKIVKRLLQTKKIDVDSVNSEGMSPLHIACQQRLPNIMVLLLGAGASVDSENWEGKTPLYLIHEQLSRYPTWHSVLLNMLEILLQHSSNPCNLAKNGESPLYEACRTANRDRSGLEMTLLHMAENNITTPSIQELFDKTLAQDTTRLLEIVPPAATALHVACQYSCEGVMDRELGDNVNTTDENGATPLLAAVKAKHHNVKIVRTLLENQALVNSRDNQGVAVLQAYVDNTQRDSQVFKLLLQHRVDLGQPDRKGNTLLHHAHRLTDGEVDMIGDSGLVTSDVVNAYNDDGDTPLHIACRANSLKAAEMLITAGASAESKNLREQSPESIAKQHQHWSMIELFANHRKTSEEDDYVEHSSTNAASVAVENNNTTNTAAGDNITANTAAVDNITANTAAGDNITANTAAVDNITANTAAVAVDNRSIPNTAAIDHSSTTSTAAADNVTECSHTSAVEKPGQDLDEAQLPLHVACRDGNDSVVSELLEGGMPTDGLCGWNRTPLHYASEGGHCVAVHYLLQQGARTETADHDGRTALHLACMGGHGTIATLLLTNGAEVDACDYDGNTPLHLSAREGHIHVCLVLIHQGAKLDMINKQKQTAIDLVNGEHMKILLQKELHRAGQKRKLLGQ